MAASQFRFAGLIFLYFTCVSQVFSIPVNVPLHSVSEVLIENALNALNKDSPTHHTYKSGTLINAQEVIEPSYRIYRLTFNLDPVCAEVVESSCPREACTIDIKQHEFGAIDVKGESIQCMYLYPQSMQDDMVQTQENIHDSSMQDQEVIENIENSMNSTRIVELDHEVQSTGDQNDKPFIAVRASTMNYCPGCPYELNPNLPGLLIYVDDILKTMDKQTNNNYKHKLVRIITVTRAVPVSSNIVQFVFLLEIGESECLKNSLVENSDCPLRQIAPTVLCLITLDEQPWGDYSRTITRNNCTDFHGGSPFTCESLVTTDETQRKESGVEDVYTGLKNILEGADKVPDSHSVGTEAEDEQSIVTEAPFIRVSLNRSDEDDKVSGFVDKVKEFNEFLEDFDIPVKTHVANPETNRVSVHERESQTVKISNAIPQGDVNYKISNEDGSYVKAYNRKKRSYFRISKDEKEFLHEMAFKAMDTLDNIDPDNRKRMVIEVTGVEKHITDNYVTFLITVRVTDTDCDETIKDIKNCKELLPENIKTCKVGLHTTLTDSEEMLRNARVISSECFKRPDETESRAKRDAMLGGSKSVDVNDTDIIQYARLGLNKFAQLSESPNEPLLVEITEATSQLVSGMLYKIKAKLGTSTCPKGQLKDECQLQSNGEVKDCLISVWSRPWLDHGNPEVTVTCDTNDRPTRSLRGVAYSQKMLQQAEYIKAERLFEEFMANFNKSYSANERKHRFKVFRKNLKLIEELRRNEQGTAEYGATMFADLTPEEFRRQRLGLRPDLMLENNIPFPMADIPDIPLPREFDWRERNVVTSVKDQGACGSCWAFSVTGNVEGQYALKHKKLLSLSEQELVDCDKLDEGCNGGLPDTAYRAIEDLGGLELESDYPYEAENEKCHFNKQKAKVQIVSAVNITSNETQMAQWLVQNGPISVGINANAMQFYMGGISHPFKFLCSPKNLDHGVLIVGYGVHTYPLFKRTMPYWIIKNSWGPRWGEQGYYRVYRGDGTCGVNTMASSAVVA